MILPLTEEVRNSALIKGLITHHELVLDNSTFITLDSCNAQGIMGAILKKMPTNNSIHLDFGSCVHSALEEKFRGGGVVDQITAAKNDPSWDAIPDGNHFAKTQEKVIEIIQAYHVHTEVTPDFDLLSFKGEPLVEQSFRLPLGNIKLSMASPYLRELFGFDMHETDEFVTIQVYWQGKIDLFTRYNNENWITDHKTTSIMGAKFADTFVRSSQMVGYLWAGMELIRHGFDKLTLPNGKVVDLSAQPYRGVLINAIAIRKSGLEFKVFPIPIPYTRLDEWRDGTLLRLRYFVEQLSEFMVTGLVAPTREHCVTKYGRCPFFDVCEAPMHMRGKMLNSQLFNTSTWSPLD